MTQKPALARGDPGKRAAYRPGHQWGAHPVDPTAPDRCRVPRPLTGLGPTAPTLARCAPLPPDHVRLPDERSRLGAHQGDARVARARGGSCDVRGGRPRLQHVHHSREARYPARGVSRRRGGTEAEGSRRRGGCRGVLRRGTARADLRAISVRRRRVRPGVDPTPRRLAHRGRVRGSPRTFRGHETFAATLPMHRERRASAWVQVSMGCNSKCAYCIVPAVRGREQSRRPGEIVAEVEALARDGVREITLLGQNVNSWGRDLAPSLVTEFGELLRACDAVEGIERIRFTSPHPKDFRAPVVAAMAECASVCEHVHLPLQSGSTRILKADAADVLARPLPGSRRPTPLRDTRPRARDRHHRRLPRRDGGRLSRDAGGRRGSGLRQRVHVRVLAARRDRGGGARRPGARRT